ncbi:MAG: hypothetical protein ABIL01_18855 [Pseudomonadota bacterium]
MSEQQAESTSSESGSVGAGAVVPGSSQATAGQASEAVAAVESPDLVPALGDAPKADAAKAEAPKIEAAKVEAAKVEAAKADAPRAPGRIMIMASGDRTWDHQGVEPEVEAEQAQGMFGKRRLSALAAVVALAAVAGALGGALATAGVMQFTGGAPATSNNLMLEASVARIDADILALKASVEQTSRAGIVRDNKTSDRLDKVEKAQAEPAAKLARLSEAVEKLKATQAAPVPVAAAAAAKDVTGSISPPATEPAAVPLPAPKPAVARLPTVEGWVLREVANGGALIEGRQGIYEVYAGDPVPGLGRIDAIRKQDGRWVVVTRKGLVVAR